MNRDYHDTIPVMSKADADEGIAHSWHLHRVHVPHDYRIHTAEVSDDAANDNDPHEGRGAIVWPVLLAMGCIAAFVLVVLVTGKQA